MSDNRYGFTVGWTAAFIRNGYDLYEQIKRCQSNSSLGYLVEKLQKETNLEIFDNKFQHVGYSKKLVDLEMLASWMIKTVQKTDIQSIEEIVDLYSEQSHFEAYAIVLLSNLYLEDSFQIDNSTELINSFKVPDQELSLASHDESLSNLPFPSYSAALLKKFEHPKFHSLDPTSPYYADYLDKTFVDLDDIKLCLGISIPSGLAIQSMGATVITPPDVPNLTERSWKIGTIRPPKPPALFAEKNFENASSIIHSFLALDEQTRERLRIPLKKINESVCSENLIEVSINLRTAMESLFLDPEANQELSHRVSIRAALLLSENIQERQKVYKQIKNAYNFGSKAVHTGRIKSKNLNSVEKDLRVAIELVIKAVKIIIKKPDINWAQVELGETT